MHELLKILPCLAAGFHEQRGELFGFGTRSHNVTGILLKISIVTNEAKQRIVNRTAVYNPNERILDLSTTRYTYRDNIV